MPKLYRLGVDIWLGLTPRAKRRLNRRIDNEINARLAKFWARAPKSALAAADHLKPINRQAARVLTRKGKS